MRELGDEEMAYFFVYVTSDHIKWTVVEGELDNGSICIQEVVGIIGDGTATDSDRNFSETFKSSSTADGSANNVVWWHPGAFHLQELRRKVRRTCDQWQARCACLRRVRLRGLGEQRTLHSLASLLLNLSPVLLLSHTGSARPGPSTKPCTLRVRGRDLAYRPASGAMVSLQERVDRELRVLDRHSLPRRSRGMSHTPHPTPYTLRPQATSKRKVSEGEG